MINYKSLIITLPTASDLREAEGCFVTLGADGTVSLTTTTTPANTVFGLIHEVEDAPEQVARVILPGFSGIPCVRLHSSSSAKAGDKLSLAANGTVKSSQTGAFVAYALRDAAAGDLCEVRLVEPFAI